MRLTQEQIAQVVAFHGHHCPGLTFGMRVGAWVLHEFGYAADEEIVAVVETDMCSVDAIQAMTGCTFGKGNFVFLDYGKNAYTFFRRSDGKNARIMARPGLLLDLKEKEKKLAEDDHENRDKVRREMITRILETDFEKIFVVQPARIPMPDMAQIHRSIPCERCGELTMATRIICDVQQTGGLQLCIPCVTQSKMENHRMSDETLFQSRLFRVERRYQTGRSGKLLERHVILHPGAVCVLPILPDGRVVLIKQYRIAVDQYLIEIPAGTLEPNEVPLDSARRELIEETGYTANNITPMIDILSSPGILREKLHLFIATDLVPGVTALEDGEDIELVIATWDEIRQMIADKKIQDAKTLIALLHYMTFGMKSR